MQKWGADMKKAFFLCMIVVPTCWSSAAFGQSTQQYVPPEFKGKIITNSKAIELPSIVKGFVANLRKQDKENFKKNEDDKWQIFFVAFFKNPSPATSLGIVVLDPKTEAVAVAEVAVEKGQRTLAAEISVDSIESPGKPHLLQVYYVKGGKPVVLAEKKILLK